MKKTEFVKIYKLLILVLLPFVAILTDQEDIDKCKTILKSI